MTCAVCRRAARGFAFTRIDIPAFDRPPTKHACSMQCLNIISERKGAMPTPEVMNALEAKAIEAASPAAGEYLESCGTTDLSRLTPEQWQGFLACVVRTVADEVQREFAENEVPF
ncbi:hypothetical protein INR77_08990 [Erythrobacter sp. SCSIO 43205]|uniref:DUF6511 domain-containing protein n=1 Tax=Erythrobacter sp. SCSIO 43205 TaxID=2779361 RepID=UPI001CA80B8C|nr:DUF6511 domain-containing protein [Erythrobacter sp. SCSIO 43205]UAB76982.1 hypothetical protein INR77_08990 [Erythrobacter sp. SCSIO 43205]